jgi:AcrR family transcriptional regulator
MEAKQERSRRTLALLLGAAESLLDERGLEGTTVPAIAERAGVSVGVVYRRFPDKDALLREVYKRYFDELANHNERQLQGVAAIRLPLTSMVNMLIIGMVEGYRRKRGLLRALMHYSRTHRDAEFRRAALEMNRRTTDNVAKVLLAYRAEIGHPDPEAAIRFGLLAVASMLRQVILEEEPLYEIATDQLEVELIRLFCGYLGIA